MSRNFFTKLIATGLFVGAIALASGLTISQPYGSSSAVTYGSVNTTNIFATRFIGSSFCDSALGNCLAGAGYGMVLSGGTVFFQAAGNNIATISASGNTNALASTATVGTAASGTGITANYSGAIRHFVHKVTVINTAMCAAGTCDITLHTTPTNTRIVRVLAEVTQVFDDGAGPLTAVAVTCGKTAGGNEYLLSHSQLSATGAFGDVVAEMGAGVVSATLADMGTVSSGVPGAITVQCRYTCTGANCSVASTGSVTYYVEGVSY